VEASPIGLDFLSLANKKKPAENHNWWTLGKSVNQPERSCAADL